MYTHTIHIQRQWLRRATEKKTSSDTLPVPKRRCCLVPYHIVNFFVFEWTLFAVITINGGCTIAELLLKDKTALQTLEYVNYVFVATYIVEAILKVRTCMLMGS